MITSVQIGLLFLNRDSFIIIIFNLVFYLNPLKTGVLMNIDKEKELENFARRFEIATENFCRSCFDMRANEKAFQAWFASYVIQEFGLSRVYREIHLEKNQLFQACGEKKDGRFNSFNGNELFPDISISWRTNIDARHTVPREKSNLNQKVEDFLSEFAIVSEFKITSSTQDPTPRADIIKDIKKLMFISSVKKENEPIRMKTYLILLDNHETKRYKPKYMSEIFSLLSKDYEDLKRPTIIVSSGDNLNVYRDFVLVNM